MELKIEIPQFSEDNGIKYKWEEGFQIETSIDNGIINIVANKDGLISLANHLLNLAQEVIPSGYHMHFDEYNSLEDGSVEMVVQKK
jgi:phosphomannomutase